MRASWLVNLQLAAAPFVFLSACHLETSLVKKVCKRPVFPA